MLVFIGIFESRLLVMRYPRNRNIHRPLHLFTDDCAYYFITARTYSRKKLFNSNEKKVLLFNCIKEACERQGINLNAWVVLGNHYHLILETEQSSHIPACIGAINGKSAKQINDFDGVRGRKVWYQYWDIMIPEKREYWTRVNYIHHNPIKHGIMSDLSAYKWSSYQNYLEKYGEEFLDDLFNEYPVISNA